MVKLNPIGLPIPVSPIDDDNNRMVNFEEWAEFQRHFGNRIWPEWLNMTGFWPRHIPPMAGDPLLHKYYDRVHRKIDYGYDPEVIFAVDE